MANRKIEWQNLWLSAVNFLLVSLGVVALLFYFRHMQWYLQILGYGCVIGFGFGSIFTLIFGKQALGRSLFILNVLMFTIIAGLCVLCWCGVLDDFSSLEQLKNLIRSSGGWAYFVYIILQFLNVVLLPLPGFLFMLAALSIFGVWPTFWVTLLVTWVGSCICFWFGRTCGSQAVKWCVGDKTAERYQKLLGTKGNLLFLIMQVLPFFPDDMLCMIAGLTKMKFSFFLLVMIVAKPLYICMVCFFGMIPFSGWGIPMWFAVCTILGVMF
ncbi:MAG: VTT domain-containing protein, partial [Clostridia bacterium]|nr:VTT domain-containing protein [Clostridia bacterium]